MVKDIDVQTLKEENVREPTGGRISKNTEAVRGQVLTANYVVKRKAMKKNVAPREKN